MITATGIFKRQDMHSVSIDGCVYAKTSQSVIPPDLKEGDQVQVTFTIEEVVPGAEIRYIVSIEKV